MGTPIAAKAPEGAAQQTGLWWAGVQRAQIEPLWDVLEPMVARLCAETDGEFEVEDFKQLALERQVQFWVFGTPGVIDLLVLTQIIHTPQLAYCMLIGMVGEHEARYRHFFFESIAPWARERGCAFVETQVRPGFVRRLKDWKLRYSVLRYYL